MTISKYRNTSKKGKQAIKKRWKDYENKLKSLHNHDPLLKAKLCGYLAGDGCVYIHKERARPHINSKRIAFYPDHIDLAKDFIETFYKIYKIRPHLKKEKNHFDIRICSKLAYWDLVSIAKFKSLNWNIPFKILTTKETKKEWIRSFFDCEAYVGKKMIQIQSINKRGLEQVKSLLKEFSIDSKMYSYERKQKNWNTNYLLCIMKKESRLKYLDIIGFRHPKKLENLKRCLNNAGVAQLGTAPDRSGDSRIRLG